ncbi:MAG: DUF5119 domain-containing protein [Odoribacter splanchnicus]
MKKVISVIISAVILSGTLSCEHKELCRDHLHVVNARVVFDWREAPDANPASMSLYLFPAGGGEVLRYDFTDRDGGIIRVTDGVYGVLCLNSDTENIRYRNTGQRETFRVVTGEATLTSGFAFPVAETGGMPRTGGMEDEPVMLPPDMIWGDYMARVELYQRPMQTITLYPKVVVCRYTVEIRNAENLKYVSGISGVLSGLAGGLFAGKAETTDERVTIPFDGVISGDKTVVTGELLTFGQCHLKRGAHHLTVCAVLSDGSVWKHTYDVTDQVHTAPDPRNVHILVDGLPVPKPIANGGGFRPNVNEWETEEENIEM